MTSLDVEEGGHGGQRHSYLFRRPRVLQYHQRGREVRYVETKTGDSVQWKRATGATPSSTAPDHSSSDDSGEGLVKQREHIDLFIDLTFVGIVSNLSEHFNTQIFYSDASETGASAPIARAMMEFVVLFISTWRLWNYLRRFVSSFFQDDIFQRFFYFWILMLVLVWGNNAPYAIGGGPGGTVALVVFLVARASFLIAEAGYSWFIPWLWPQLLLTLGLNVPAAALWIGAIRADDWLRIGLLMGALVAELVATAMIASPLLDRLLNDGRKISHDAEHYAVRLEAFFIVILGEGVMLLAKGSPLGQGISYMTGSGTMALSIFFGIYMLYFRGDYSRNYVQAMRHSWWKDSLWGFAHVILFGSLFLLDVAVLSLVINGGVYADQSDATSAATAARAVRARDSAPDSDNLLRKSRRPVVRPGPRAQGAEGSRPEPLANAEQKAAGGSNPPHSPEWS
ncbi:MAG: hypothetical protein M1838_002039 [Thelocarpon superellum]|nr:MAG: hypothetical protein M1838_002039 [Thelocarpon superellum]